VREALGGALAVLSADLRTDLGVHQRLRQHAHALAQPVGVGGFCLAQQLCKLHLGGGHRVLLRRVD
jgi:hypothetical protein